MNLILTLKDLRDVLKYEKKLYPNSMQDHLREVNKEAIDKALGKM